MKKSETLQRIQLQNKGKGLDQSPFECAISRICHPEIKCIVRICA